MSSVNVSRKLFFMPFLYHAFSTLTSKNVENLSSQRSSLGNSCPLRRQVLRILVRSAVMFLSFLAWKLGVMCCAFCGAKCGESGALFDHENPRFYAGKSVFLPRSACFLQKIRIVSGISPTFGLRWRVFYARSGAMNFYAHSRVSPRVSTPSIFITSPSITSL